MKRLSYAATTIALMVLPLLNVWAAPSSDPAGKGLPLVFSENFEKGADRWTMTDPRLGNLRKTVTKRCCRFLEVVTTLHPFVRLTASHGSMTSMSKVSYWKST